MQIQFIWCWNMWEIILQSIISSWYNSKDISVKTKTEEKEIELKKLYNINTWVNNESDILILAIKPKQFNELDLSIFKKNILVISIMAWISKDKIESKINSDKIIRTMPNTPMSVWKWVIWYIETDSVTNKEKDFFIQTFSKNWKLIECKNEDEIDKITALSWSWPAYFYYFTEIIKQKAIEMWFSEEQATIISNNTFIWASNLLEKSNLTIEQLRQNITSPWGTTEKAIEIFKSNWFKKCITDAIDNAYNKAIQLNN